MKCGLCHSEGNDKFKLGTLTVQSCTNCGLVFLLPPVNGTPVADLYGRDYYWERKKYFFDNIVADPEHGRRDTNIEEFARTLSVISSLVPARGNLLDVGCGPGIFLQMARAENWHVTGVDISPFACRYAREAFGLDVRQGELTDLRFPSEHFNVVTMWDTIEHLVDPLVELREIHRILKPKGLFLLNTPNQESLLRTLAHLLHTLTLRGFSYPLKKLYHIYHLYYFSSSSLTSMVEMAGLSVSSLKRRPIPIVKARATRLEKVIVRALSLLERLSGREYELFLVAQKQ